MGYKLERFTDVIDIHFCCEVCEGVPKDPVRSPCCHIFCNKCVVMKLLAKGSRRCPSQMCFWFFRVEELKPVPVYFHRELNQMKLSCEFEGCNQVFPLNRIEEHALACQFNENAENAGILCNKECKMAIDKDKYYGHSCILNLNKKLKIRQDENKLETESMSRHQDKIADINKEMLKLPDRLREAETAAKVRRFRPPTYRWLVFANVQNFIDAPNILACNGVGQVAFAQSLFALSERNSDFHIRILDGIQGSIIAMGLTKTGHPNKVAPGNHNESIGFNSRGKLFYDKKERETIASPWEFGDIIGCTMKKGNACIKIHFFRNGLMVARRRFPYSFHDEYHPTVYIRHYSRPSVIPKMGYKLERFTDVIDIHFCCEVCEGVPKDPVRSPCCHIFCNQCVVMKLLTKGNRKCPSEKCLWELRVEQLKSVPVYFHRELNQMKLSCEFEGCNQVFPLNRIEEHALACQFNENAENAGILCNKECKMAIDKDKYYGHSCILNLNKKLKIRQDENKLETESMSRHQDKIADINKEMLKLSDRLREAETAATVRCFRPPTYRWLVFANIENSIDTPNILECYGVGQVAFAQSIFALSERNSDFHIKILNGIKGSIIAMGLTKTGHPNDVAPGLHNESIGFNNKGKLFNNKKERETIASHWEIGDTIGCTMKKGNACIKIHFFRNGLMVARRRFPYSFHDEYHPTVYIRHYSRPSVIPKVEFYQDSD
ncbi:E3 ubiquitin-protein ligase NRDP1 [Pseudolycoriella hygida]|uniref:E3 ubiquitin-protein ligase NRDP1 n=1 Tax=Pseudolycoriella hygida TaxID=35572 RepID=A0A9Q0NHB3_9DIPT|nr:E3 ubiquitin-protein ligase NRDP1 [Pseudolycoriella hygida]